MKQQDIQSHLVEAKDYLVSELSKIRTGKAAASMVEDIVIAAYEGSDPLPLNELATISTPDPQSLLISPWDKSILDKIEDAIVKSEKGLNPINDGENIRVPIPPLTEERRAQIAKDVSERVEQAKIRVRNIRQNAMKALEEQEENGVISEDEFHRQKKLIEEEISKANKEIEDIGKQKTQDVMTI